MSRLFAVLLAFASLTTMAPAAEKYRGPRPPKADVPYLMHADNLVETDSTNAGSETKKDGTLYNVPGAAAQARTPMGEPIFLMQVKSLSADKLGLYRFEVKNGRREIFVPSRPGKRRGNSGPFRVRVTRVDDDLYKIEAEEALENGQYSLSPDGSDKVFSFEVY